MVRFVAGYGAFALVWGGIAIAALLGWYGSNLPATDGLRTGAPGRMVTILDASGRMVARRGAQGAYVPIAQIPQALQDAVIATEDRRFYSHFGLDPAGVVRAAFANAEAGRVVQGGSTITQQLAKNLFLTQERTFERKIQEAVLALWLELKFGKDEILELYLNRVYFGAGAFGVEAAAHRYFNKAAAQLGLAESATLAGLLKAPSRYSPRAAPELARERQIQVLASMVEAGLLPPAEAARARAETPRLASPAATPGAQYFADWVLEELPGFAGRIESDLFVETALDLRLQRAAEGAMQAVLDGDGLQSNAGEGALVAMTTDGAVRAMVGGRSYGNSQFNRAVQARRQPGSAIKPFVYLAALENGWHEHDTVADLPVRVGGWQPANFEGKYEGEVTLARALARSSNAAAVRLVRDVGPSKVVAAAQRFGLSGNMQADASLALGVYEASLLELTGAYTPFANGGARVRPHAILRVRTKEGRVLYERRGGLGQAADPAAVGAINRMLAAALVDGTGHAAALPGRVAAGKTGTSQDFRDAWFVGYTADLVAGVWFGNDDGEPMRRVTGGGLPARAWHAFMAEAVRDMPARPLPGILEMPQAGSTLIAAMPPDAQAAGLFDRILAGILGESEAPTD